MPKEKGAKAPTSACTLLEWIELHFDGNQRAFASAQGVQPPQVTQWIKKDFIVSEGSLYSPRRKLNAKGEK